MPKTKKRHVESMTRLPTKRLATACWDFIVVKRGGLQTAPLLDFWSLQPANSKMYQQLIHKFLWMSWGQISKAVFVAQTSEDGSKRDMILPLPENNHPKVMNVSKH